MTRASARQLMPGPAGHGGGVGLLPGVFGIGDGFLIVPGLVASTRIPFSIAVGSSLVVVSAVGATTAVRYALSGLVDRRLAVLFVGEGVFGEFAGAMTSRALASRRTWPTRVFCALFAIVSVYVVVKAI